ncbi:unnamed protein product [Moneuplotes crassus]|uniref:Uncharacterized protein n=1 Tax=Euplotes crassus TaxID=5936 RepID=A0AAD1XKA4_EUPCR|nr:unnamed protein product [Moneuplotes crassus]
MNQPTVKLVTEITDLAKIDSYENYLHPDNIFASLAEQSLEKRISNFWHKERYCNSERSSSTLSALRRESYCRELKKLQIFPIKDLHLLKSQTRAESKKICEITNAVKYSQRLRVVKTSSSPIPSNSRRDVAYKSALRLVKRYFKNTYKNHILDISEKRQKTLSIDAVCTMMHNILSSLIPYEFLTMDLAYYTIGITGIRNTSALPCSSLIQNEISSFQVCASTFSQQKFLRALDSESLITLCCYITQKSNDPRLSVLRNEVSRIRGEAN